VSSLHEPGIEKWTRVYDLCPPLSVFQHLLNPGCELCTSQVRLTIH